MPFGRWLRPKGIKHVAVQAGSAHPSEWNVKLNLQLKRSFFFFNYSLASPQFFRGRFYPKRGYKTFNKSFFFLNQSIPRASCHASHFRTRSKNADALPNQVSHFQRATNKQTSHLRTTYTLSPSWWKKRRLTPTYFRTCIWWKKRALTYRLLYI